MRSDRYKDEPAVEKKKKKRGPLKGLIILILILIAAIAGTTAYVYKSTYDSLSVTFTEEAPVIEFGESCPSMQYVKDSYGDIEPGSDYLETDKIGSGEIVYKASESLFGGLLKPEKEFRMSYTVKDSIAPVKIWSWDGAVLERGTEFDINDVVAYGDNADPTPLISVDGKVNMEKNGRYPLHVKVTDSSGNTIEWDLTVEVADAVPAYEDTSERTPFADFVSANKGDKRSFGIDVSAWQDEIDFKAVKKAGCEFVIIRIGYTSDGAVNIDKTFYSNLSNARAAGLRTGVYLYCTDNTEEMVRGSADWIIDTLGGANLDFPVAFDWEDFGNFQDYGMSFYELNRLYDAFADELSQAGYGCMLYGSKNYLENMWEKTDIRPVWLAHYTEKTDYKGPYILWQASSTGRISGIGGDVDMDILYISN
ncbi:MAG: DUF5011 domain-containing protein [Mogibacterium sp.]|nr:DUF5011 domain-containing protein [Mogibacterium sp.]